jgi:3,4-dihydroxy 2-butanone 4-phosphate synthase / GTP cyclohydrolase II
MLDLAESSFSRTTIRPNFVTTGELIKEAQQGHSFILLNDQDRDHEACLVTAAQFVTAETINFMARHARGLICLAITQERAELLRLPFMPRSIGAMHQEAFTVSTEARDGVSTGISSHDRAKTVAVAIDPHSTYESIATPGHMFPLVACPGGVLERAAYAEAAVDIARLAELNPSAVICRMMSDDGSMAHWADLQEHSHTRSLKIGLISDIVDFRRRREGRVTQIHSKTFHNGRNGEWTIAVYMEDVAQIEYAVLIKGDLSMPGAPIVRVADTRILVEQLLAPQSSLLHEVMERIAAEGRGAIVLRNGLTAAALLQDALQWSTPPQGIGSRLDDEIVNAILADLRVGSPCILADIEDYICEP